MRDAELTEPQKGPSIEEQQLRVNAGLESGVPKLYFNGFVCAFGPGDLFIILERNGKPEGVLNMSFSVAKTLSSKLADLVRSLEVKTGNTIMTTEDVQKRLQKKEQ